MFASGLWNGENTEEFFSKGQELSYFEHLKIIHLNNSKYPTGSKKDRHANIFQNGLIKPEFFQDIVTSPIIKHIPFVLETPDDEGISHKEEINQLTKKWG